MQQSVAQFEQFSRDNNPPSDSESDKPELKRGRGRPKKVPSPGPSPVPTHAPGPREPPPKQIPTPKEKVTDDKRREKVEAKLKNYQEQFGSILDHLPWTPGVTPVEEEERIARVYESQLTSMHQFETGRMLFLRAADNLPKLMQYVAPDMDLTNLGPLTEKNYTLVFEPTWKELIIKYDLFRFGPELRFIFIIQDWLRLVDAKNKQRNQNANAPNDSKFKTL